MSIHIKLGAEDVQYLEQQKKSGHLCLRKYNRINILLLLDKGKRVKDIEDFLSVDRITIWRVKKSYQESGVEAAIEEGERPGQPVKYTVAHQTELASIACGPCPEGRTRWTIQLLTETLRARPGFENINRESVRLALKKMNVSLG